MVVGSSLKSSNADVCTISFTTMPPCTPIVPLLEEESTQTGPDFQIIQISSTHRKKNVRHFKDVFCRQDNVEKKPRDFLGLRRQSLVNLQPFLVFKEFRGRFPWKPRKAVELQGIGAKDQGNRLVFSTCSCF